jgi:hypothetical protein
VEEVGSDFDGMLSFAPRPLALVVVAEKGYADQLVTTKWQRRTRLHAAPKEQRHRKSSQGYRRHAEQTIPGENHRTLKPS